MFVWGLIYKQNEVAIFEMGVFMFKGPENTALHYTYYHTTFISGCVLFVLISLICR